MQSPQNKKYVLYSQACINHGHFTENYTFVVIAETQCKVEGPKNSEQYLEPTLAMSRYAVYLKGVYMHASDEKIPKVSHSGFIDLALVKKTINRSEADKHRRATVHGDIDKIMKERKPIRMDDVLKPNEGQQNIKFVFVQGALGIGKSTFALEFCRRWDSTEALRKYALIVLLRLREKRVQEIQNVADLFYHYDNPNLQHSVARDVIESEGKNILLVFDGFDELPTEKRKQSFLVDVICGIRIPHCTVLVTSRPSASADLYSVAQSQIQKEIEILGFTQERIELYAASIFASQPDLLSDFLKYVVSNPVIRSLMYIPLNGTILTEIYRANRTTGRPIPHTMTQLYSELSHVLLTRYLVDKGDKLAEELPEKLKDLPPQLYNPIHALAKLAFDGIQIQEQIFSKLPVECHGDHFGFMDAPAELYMGHKTRKSYNFLHFTLQQFFAAFYISQHLSIELQKVIFDFKMVGRFLAGLTGITEAWYQFFSEYKQLEEVEPFGLPEVFLQCLYESQSIINYQATFGATKMQFRNDWRTTVFDYFALGECIAKSNCPWILHLNMVLTRSGSEPLAMLACGLNSSSRECGSIEELNVGYNPNFDCAHLSEFPTNILQELLTLRLSYCELDHSSLANIVPALIRLKVLDISNTPAQNGGLVKLFTKLANLRHLEELDVSNVNMDMEDINALSTLIKKPALCVKTLVIGDETMSCDCVRLMLQLVLSPSSLETLLLTSNMIVPPEDASLFRSIANNLTQLALLNCAGIKVVIPHLANSISTNNSLEELLIIEHRVDSDWKVELLALNDALKQNLTLRSVHLSPLVISFCSDWDKRVQPSL